jgi:hypothetical protein
MLYYWYFNKVANSLSTMLLNKNDDPDYGSDLMKIKGASPHSVIWRSLLCCTSLGSDVFHTF